MRRLLILVLASCTLDPHDVFVHLALTVRAFNLPSSGGSLELTTTDARAQVRTKKTVIVADEMDVLYEQGSLADGEVVISAELFDAEHHLIGCGTARGVVGQDALIVVGFASPDTSAVNCGTCGNR